MLFNFVRKKIPEETPPEAEKLLADLRESKSKEECARNAYNAVISKFEGRRVKTFTRPFDLIFNSPDNIWKKGGFLHCTNLNYAVRYLLVTSGCFEDADIEHRWGLIWMFSPHQYLRVRLTDDRYINIDPWGSYYGVPYGKHAHGFNTTLWPKRRV